ncbi:MAG: DUF3551 domain-containing protein [Xanthobacteraceae bacterium]
MTSPMKLSMLALGFFAATAALAPPAGAQNYPWCAIYNGGGVGGGTNCGFVTYEQCMATASGLGKFCVRNTQYVPPPGPHPRRPYGYPY